MLRDPRLGPPPNFSNHLISHFFQITATFSCLFVNLILQGDTSDSGCAKPPVDFKGKVPFWPGLTWPGQSRTVVLKLMGGFAEPDVSPYTVFQGAYGGLTMGCVGL